MLAIKVFTPTRSFYCAREGEKLSNSVDGCQETLLRPLISITLYQSIFVQMLAAELFLNTAVT